MQIDLADYDFIDMNHFSVDTPITPVDKTKTPKPTNTNSENANEVEKDVYCLRCGRKLIDHDSKEIGMGPLCLKHFRESKSVAVNLLSIVKPNGE